MSGGGEADEREVGRKVVVGKSRLVWTGAILLISVSIRVKFNDHQHTYIENNNKEVRGRRNARTSKS